MLGIPVYWEFRSAMAVGLMRKLINVFHQGVGMAPDEQDMLSSSLAIAFVLRCTVDVGTSSVSSDHQLVELAMFVLG